jgi:LTXXQ motif family protein
LAHPLTTNHPEATAGRVRPLAHAADPGRFEERRRRFADNAAFHPFWHHDWWRYGWHPYYHLGWIGPVFWPYAYGDFFYYALWPYDYEYVDPFWAYGYGDIYQAIFTPYSYQDLVEGPQAPERMATLAQGMAQSCDDEAAEVTGWPIDQIQSAVQPNPQQTALLDDLGNAIVEASHQIKIHCPTSVAFTPTARLDQMHQRLEALVDAVNLISPPLTKFYDSLSDEQKARFDDIAPPAPPQAQGAQGGPSGQQGKPNVQAQCNASVMAWPTDRIDDTLHPSDAQRTKLEALQSALSQGAETIKAACPTEVPATPPSRLAAIGNRLNAMLQAVQTVQPALSDFYDSLSDDQKARFNTMGKQLFAQNP